MRIMPWPHCAVALLSMDLGDAHFTHCLRTGKPSLAVSTALFEGISCFSHTFVEKAMVNDMVRLCDLTNKWEITKFVGHLKKKELP